MNNSILIKKILLIFIPIGLAVIILFPFSPAKFTHYDLWPSYFALILFIIIFLPTVFFLSRTYWSNRITILIWFLRFLMIINFLLVGIRTGISSDDIVSISGTISLTLFYELGYFLTSVGRAKKFLVYWVWLNVIICAGFLPFLVTTFLHQGLNKIIYESIDIHSHVISWPNAFGLAVSLALFLSIIFFQKNKKYIFALLIMLPVLFFTDAKGASLGLLISLITVGLISLKKNKNFALLLFLFVLITAGYTFYNNKNLPYGSQISHSAEMRFWRWKTYISVWEKAPLLGYGFKSFTKIIPKFYYPPNDAWDETGSSHIDYLDILVRGGIIYSIFYWLFVLYVTYLGFRFKYIFRYLACSIIIILVAAFIQNPFKDPVVSAYFWIVVAIIAYYSQFRKINQNNNKLKKLNFETYV